MNKLWLYVGSIIVGATLLAFTVISVVSRTHSPAY